MNAQPNGLQQLQQKVLKNWSTTKFRIEYDGYLSNHLLHALIALYEVGASENQIESYADKYVTKLEVQEDEHKATLTPEEAALTVESARALVGKRENFYGLVAFYEGEIEKNGVDGAVKIHLPVLVGGLAGSLFHGIIQLGYSYHIGGERLIAEGLAYLHFSYLSFDESTEPKTTLKESEKPFTRDVALRLAHALAYNEFLLSEMNKQLATEPLKSWPTGLLQRKLMGLSSDKDRGSLAAFQVISDTLQQYDLSKINGTFALDLILWLYNMVESNDFVVLHAVTSAWSLQQVEHVLSPEDLQRGWQAWLHSVLSAYVVQQVRDLRDYDFSDRTTQAVDSWETILRKTVELEGFQDEHVYKLVQVAHDHSAKSKEDGFLSVVERDFVARSAARKVISTPFAAF